MTKRTTIFLSYSRANRALANSLATALGDHGAKVWRDEKSISGGEQWSNAIDDGIRDSRGLVVLVTKESAASHWVTYEYAFATGAGVPVLAVAAQRTKIPDPIQRFQRVRYSNPEKTAEEVQEGFRKQARKAGRERAAGPRIMAKFKERDGTVMRVSGGPTPELRMELWVEYSPKDTMKVTFEIPDEGVRDNRWTVRRRKRDGASPREFLTDERFNLWGDVEIWAYGIVPGRQPWSAKSTLFEALQRYYRGSAINSEIRGALSQIKNN